MFDAVRNNKRIVQIFLLLIAVPFAMWGVDAYLRGDGAAAPVARAGDAKITLKQFQQALREQQDRMRAQLPGVDVKLLDSPAIRESVLNGLVDQRLLQQEIARLRLGVSAEALRQTIAGVPAFQEKGQFSSKLYESVLAAQGMTPASFEAQLQQDLALQALIGAIGDSAFVPRTVAERVVALQGEVRQVQEVRFTWQSFADQVRLEAGEAEKFYKDNAARFTLPEQVRVAYAVLTQKDLEAGITVSEQEAKAWYEAHHDLYMSAPEMRRASHILLTTEGADKAKVKAEAEALLAELRKDPSRFAEIAKQRSRDPGSAAKGGDLGFFKKGSMVKPFEDAVFALKEGELSDVVETDYGFHIIRLTAIKPGQLRPFAEVRRDIEAELKHQKAARSFAEAAENFSNLVYEQADSLKPAAERYKLTLQTSGWLTRQGGQPALLNHPKLLEALFSDDAIKNGRNTEAVEVASGTLVAAHVLEHKAATLRPFESVRTEIETELKKTKAMALAEQRGEAALAALTAGKDENLAWSPLQRISRMAPGPFSGAALAAVFRVDARKLPGYTGIRLPDTGYALYKVVRVEAGEIEPALAEALTRQLNSIAGRSQVEAYLAALRKRYKVELDTAAIATSKE